MGSAVQLLERRGVDLIKVHNFTSRDVFFAIAEETRRQGLPLAGHVPRQGHRAGGRRELVQYWCQADGVTCSRCVASQLNRIRFYVASARKPVVPIRIVSGGVTEAQRIGSFKRDRWRQTPHDANISDRLVCVGHSRLREWHLVRRHAVSIELRQRHERRLDSR